MGKTVKVSKVLDVKINLLKSNPPQLLITAIGIVPTTGYSNASLSEYIYITPPKDGIQDFDFLAEQPDGAVHQTLSPISASAILVPIPKWARGVRINTAQNRKTLLFGKGQEIEIK